jgi:hypothetical protein
MPIRHKRTSTSGYTWTTSDLVIGQIGINTADGTAHIRRDNDSIATLASGLTIATTSQAEDGTNNTNAITPLRLREALRASGTAPVYACRAWANFDGTTTVPSVRASGNISSITRNSTANYTVNFTTAMPDVNYAFVGSGGIVSGAGGSWGAIVVESHNNSSFIRTTTSLPLLTFGLTASFANSFTCNVAIFR